MLGKAARRDSLGKLSGNLCEFRGVTVIHHGRRFVGRARIVQAREFILDGLIEVRILHSQIILTRPRGTWQGNSYSQQVSRVADNGLYRTSTSFEVRSVSPTQTGLG